MHEVNQLCRYGEEWRTTGKNFLVVVKHWAEIRSPQNHERLNRWNVYAYIYPRHKLFSEFKGESVLQDAVCGVPLHGGPSFLKVHRSQIGDVTSVQLGSDYNHIYDAEFLTYKTPEEAREVFADAEKLIKYLNNKDKNV